MIATPEHRAGMRRRMAARIHALPEGRDCRLVALTGYGQDADRARSQAAGFERHLVSRSARSMGRGRWPATDRV